MQSKAVASLVRMAMARLKLPCRICFVVLVNVSCIWAGVPNGGESTAIREWREETAAAIEQRAQGAVNEARESLLLALATAEGFDEGDVRLGATLNHLAVVELDLGRVDCAGQLVRRALDIWQRQGPTSGPEHADTLNNLGACQRYNGQLTKAERTYGDALGKCGEHKQCVVVTATALNSIGEIRYLAGDIDTAAQNFAEAARPMDAYRPGSKTIHGLAAGLNNLGVVCRAKGLYGEAEAAWSRAKELLMTARLSDGSTYGYILANEATLKVRSGRLGEAEELCQEALQIFRRHMLPETPEVMLNYADILKRMRRKREARRIRAEAAALIGQNGTKTIDVPVLHKSASGRRGRRGKTVEARR